MAITNGYTSLNTLKAHIGISDTTDDTRLERIVTAVSRQIDNHCRRQFYAATQTRYFDPVRPCELLLPDDLLSITTLKTDTDGDRTYETTWATTDYDLEPANAQLESQPEPYWLIRVTPLGRYSFPCAERSVQIAGSWGYSSTTPPVVEEACLLQSARVFERSKSAFGIAGDPNIGTVRLSAALDPDVKMFLEKLVLKRVR